MSIHIAVDIGSSAVKMVAARVQPGGPVFCDEIYRFITPQRRTDNLLCWDLPLLLEQIKIGIGRAVAAFGPVDSIGFDSFGVDYVLLDEKGECCAPCISYRDKSHLAMAEISKTELCRLFAMTGGYFPIIGSIHRLRHQLRVSPLLHRRINSVLTLADYVAWCFSGRLCIERSGASTLLLLDTRNGTWSLPALAYAGLTIEQMPPLVDPGDVLGTLRPELAAQPGLAATLVVAPCSHDTGNITASCFRLSDEPQWFLSCGSWALYGIEHDRAQMGDDAFAAGLTNECAASHRVQTLYNLPGMWPVQRLKVELAPNEQDAVLIGRANQSTYRAAIDFSDEHLLSGDNFRYEVDQQCRRQCVPLPAGVDDYIRLALNSLCDGVARAAKALRSITGYPLTPLLLVGGGSRSDWLTQQLANFLQQPVARGAGDATSLGNLYYQLRGCYGTAFDFPPPAAVTLFQPSGAEAESFGLSRESFNER
ncbi:rhamnulokinase [Sodalis ligni]|uniref:Rhamnulokinase n=1 Tax=Sodalis ligni TaxID=2697027 RepID=A0A4R1NEX9_9GAMM|nr:FGGY family carbohydrate kinase [Sodalis ligni]TCL05449.1 rhamnulokinase [Sodalis ligni]